MSEAGKLNLLCLVFGHQKMPRGWYGDIEYGDISVGVTDGTGRIHGTVRHECWRCGKKYIVSRIHVNVPVVVSALREANGHD